MQYGQKTKCPLCSYEFILEEIYEEGDMIVCVNCEKRLVVESLNPPRLVPGKGEKANKKEEQFED
ncbi:MAG: hypothetical protein JXJ19_08000 [Elusimicrobia bacterium]|nr:hypothetical protein [Elusimicrobiota bacterium]